MKIKIQDSFNFNLLDMVWEAAKTIYPALMAQDKVSKEDMAAEVIDFTHVPDGKGGLHEDYLVDEELVRKDPVPFYALMKAEALVIAFDQMKNPILGGDFYNVVEEEDSSSLKN